MSVFAYLTDTDHTTLTPNTLMTFNQFLRIQGEEKIRNIDPFEL